MSPLPRTLLLLLAAGVAAACGKEPAEGPGGPAGPGGAPSPAGGAARVEWDPELLVPKDEEFVPPPGSGSAWLTGTVVDETGAPVPGATVEVLAVPRGDAPGIVPNLHARTETGPDGRFRVGPGPDPWHEKGLLSAHAPGYARTSLRSSRVTVEGEPFADEGREVTVALRRGIPVEGRIRVVDGRPPDAPVTLWVAGEESFHELLETDAEGRFAFLAPPCRIQVSAMAGAHGPARGFLQVEEGGENRIEIAVRRGRDIRGRVVDLRTGDPVPGAVLRGLYGRTKVFRADAEGKFELPRYWFRAFQVRAPGYAERIHLLSSESGAPGSVPEVVRLAPGCVVRGVARDLDGRPAGGIRVRTFHEDAAGDMVDVIGPTTASDGSFTFVGIPIPDADREIRVFGIADDFAFGHSPPLHPRAGEVVDGVVVSVPRLVDLRGTVRDEKGEPAGGTVRVRWTLPPGLAPYRNIVPSENKVLVGSDGRWVVRVPERADLTVAALSEDYESKEVEAKAPPHPDSASPAAAGEREPVRIEAYRGLSIRGLVLDAAGEPVRSGAVRVEPHPPSDPRNSRDATIRPDGTFEAGGLQPGLYDFSVLSAPRYLQEVVRRVEAGGPPVEVRSRRAGGMMGRVVLPEGAPEETPVFVSLHALGDTTPLPSRHDLRITARDRAFTVGPLAPVAYRVSFVGGDWRKDLDRVEIEDGEGTDLGEVVLAAGGAVEGRILVQGAPVAAARIEVFRPLPGGAAKSEGTVDSGEDGRFRKGGLSGGPHFLSVRPLDRPILEVPFESVPGETTPLDLEVPPGGVAVVRVLDPAGTPAAGARVLFTGGEGGVPFWKEGSPAPGPHQTGEDGVLRCSGLPAGDLRVFAEKAGVGSAEAPVRVADGAIVSVEVRLVGRER